MEIYPAIDLRDGQVVRLTQGDFSQSTVYGEDPLAVVASFMDQGARWIHVVDLDGARTGVPGAPRVIGEIVRKFSGKVQVGGGIRSLETARLYFGCGADRLVLGTGAFTDPAFLAGMLGEFPGRFYVGLDVRNNRIAISGWLSETAGDPMATMKEMADTGVAGFVYTDILKDGMLSGPNLPVYRTLTRDLSVPVIASGGVGTLADLRALGEIGVAGAIVGRALYTGAVTLRDALALSRPEDRPC